MVRFSLIASFALAALSQTTLAEEEYNLRRPNDVELGEYVDVKADLDQADADFERVLGGTYYSYPPSASKGSKGSKGGTYFAFVFRCLRHERSHLLNKLLFQAMMMTAKERADQDRRDLKEVCILRLYSVVFIMNVHTC
jgi:hypothetical protein